MSGTLTPVYADDLSFFLVTFVFIHGYVYLFLHCQNPIYLQLREIIMLIDVICIMRYKNGIDIYGRVSGGNQSSYAPMQTMETLIKNVGFRSKG